MIMADHGSRYNAFRATNAGHREDNNPAFILTIPEDSDSTVIKHLKENKKRLITGFDIHATLNHILNNGPSTKRGISLLSPIPIRTCKDLEIPPYFCICETNSRRFFDKILVNQLANFLVSSMNEQLNPFLNLCDELHLNPEKSPVVEQIFLKNTTEALRAFKVTIWTSPGRGNFWAYLEVDDRSGQRIIKNIAHKIFRTNNYLPEIFCGGGNHTVESFCHCKSHITEKLFITFINPNWYISRF